jgi:hypothetical protein
MKQFRGKPSDRSFASADPTIQHLIGKILIWSQCWRTMMSYHLTWSDARATRTVSFLISSPLNISDCSLVKDNGWVMSQKFRFMSGSLARYWRRTHFWSIGSAISWNYGPILPEFMSFQDELPIASWNPGYEDVSRPENWSRAEMGAICMEAGMYAVRRKR